VFFSYLFCIFIARLSEMVST